MTKSTTRRTWLTGLGLMLAALVLLGTGIGLMLSNGGTWVPGPHRGSDFHPTINAFLWGTVTTVAAGGLTFLAGRAAVAAWIGSRGPCHGKDLRHWVAPAVRRDTG